jgi:hypothetical protein
MGVNRKVRNHDLDSRRQTLLSAHTPENVNRQHVYMNQEFYQRVWRITYTVVVSVSTIIINVHIKPNYPIRLARFVLPRFLNPTSNQNEPLDSKKKHQHPFIPCLPMEMSN